MFGALWSEHCGYKNSKPLLARLPTEGAAVLQGPGENAGVVDLGDGDALAFKMESHNHPSAVEPFQGAATGVGGILRDVFAMGARPFAVLDSLRFGPLESDRSRYLLAGVVEGIAHYGNAIGVPTVGGEIHFHDCYRDNPLVNVMALGLMKAKDMKTGTVGAPGNLLIYVGSKTGRDGLGGAVFASADLSDSSDADRPAVQVGDPFMEKLLLEACLEAMREGLVVGIQDMGAAGLTSSVAEMAHRAGRGVEFQVGRVPTREPGMAAAEVMLSESQERMVLVISPERRGELLELLTWWELDAVEVGKVADHGRFKVYRDGALLADVPIAALNDPPTYTRTGIERTQVRRQRETPVDPPQDPDLATSLLLLMASPTIASKRAVFQQFDHQVMTNTVVLPGVADAAVLRLKGTTKAVAATIDCNARFVYLDPEEGAKHAVAEAARNLVCVGATPLGVTDNLNFGNPNRADVYYQLERAIEGLRQACIALGTPVTGGNVSFYNQYRADEGLRAIHPTPTVGMVGLLRDVTRRATMPFKRGGDIVFLVGENTEELGASEYLSAVHGREIGRPPRIDLATERAVQDAVRSLIEDGVCDTAHDCSEGGLAAALAEMAIGGDRGAEIALSGGSRPEAQLFGEAPSRIVIAVSPGPARVVSEYLELAGVAYRKLGVVTGSSLRITAGAVGLNVELTTLRERYEYPIREALS